VRTDKRLKRLVDFCDFPEHTTRSPRPEEVPSVFVVNAQLPVELWSDDGPGYSVVYYFGMKPETAAHLASDEALAAAPPAVRLLREWVAKAAGDVTFRGRFKAMALAQNIASLAIPKVVHKFNGKPVLIKKTGTPIRGPDWLEYDINVHGFSLLAKQGLQTTFDMFQDMVANIGFTIEGRCDAELPEVMLGVAQLTRCGWGTAFEWKVPGAE